MPIMHREEYYNADTIAGVAGTMAGKLPVNSRAAAFSPAAAALLVIDMQRYFLHPDSHAFLPSAAAIIPRINALIDAFAKTGRPVFFTRHGNDKRDGAQMATWWGELLTRDHPLAGLENSLDLAGRPVIEKSQYDAFFNTDLDARLRQWRTGNWSSPASQRTFAAKVLRVPPFRTVFRFSSPSTEPPPGIASFISPACADSRTAAPFRF